MNNFHFCFYMSLIKRFKNILLLPFWTSDCPLTHNIKSEVKQTCYFFWNYSAVHTLWALQIFRLLSIMQNHHRSIWSAPEMYSAYSQSYKEPSSATRRTSSLATDGVTPTKLLSQHHGVNLWLHEKTEAVEMSKSTELWQVLQDACNIGSAKYLEKQYVGIRRRTGAGHNSILTFSGFLHSTYCIYPYIPYHLLLLWY